MDQAPQSRWNSRYHDPAFPLHHASFSDDRLETVRFLLDKFPEGVDVQTSNSCIPLHYACEDEEDGGREVARCLLFTHIARDEGIHFADFEEPLHEEGVDFSATARCTRLLAEVMEEQNEVVKKIFLKDIIFRI